MMRWILGFSALCAASATLGFGRVLPPASLWSGVSLAVFAFSAVLLIASFDALETQGSGSDDS